MISLNDARAQRITRVRLPEWSNRHDHLELHITPDGFLGPWAKLWSPVNERIGAPNPQTILMTGTVFDFDKVEWEPYVVAE